MKRLFVAIPVSEEVQRKIKPILQEVRETAADFKLVSLENLHFTVTFLGDVEEIKISEIVNKLSSIQQQRFSFSIRGMGVFPSLERINVVWIGVKGKELSMLVNKVNAVLNYTSKEQREDVPHLTIARVKSGKNKEKLQEVVEKNKHTIFGEMIVDRFVLYESELGPAYTVVKDFALA